MCIFGVRSMTKVTESYQRQPSNGGCWGGGVDLITGVLHPVVRGDRRPFLYGCQQVTVLRVPSHLLEIVEFGYLGFSSEDEITVMLLVSKQPM